METKVLRKADLYNAIMDTTSLRKADIDAVITAYFDVIVNAIKDNKRVTVGPLGSMTLKLNPARICRNPRTGEAIEVPAKYAVRFKASSLLKSAINGHEEE